jgi:hypothetical protein
MGQNELFTKPSKIGRKFKSRGHAKPGRLTKGFKYNIFKLAFLQEDGYDFPEDRSPFFQGELE